MSKFKSQRDIYSYIPLEVADNRDEYFLIDAIGAWIPECEIVFYGLMMSEYSNIFPKLKTMDKINPTDFYLDYSYLNAEDLIRYLASDNEEFANLSQDEITNALITAINNYLYVPCSETLLRHTILEAAYAPFVKSITISYPWELRDIDYQYVLRIIPESLQDKIYLRTGSQLDLIRSHANSNEPQYTTIITNSIEDVKYMIENAESLKTSESFFLLRNHSGNTSMKQILDKIVFEEEGTRDILKMIIDPNTGFPNCKMRFSRYEPLLFNGVKQQLISQERMI